MKGLRAFLSALVTTYILAVLMYSQLNLGNIVELGIEVSLADRFGTAMHDLVGMAALYLPIILVALLLGFGVARLIIKWVPQLRTVGYMLAGFVAIFTVDWALSTFLTGGTHPLVVTRTTVGLLSQCVAGAVGGFVFATLLPIPEAKN